MHFSSSDRHFKGTYCHLMNFQNMLLTRFSTHFKCKPGTGNRYSEKGQIIKFYQMAKVCQDLTQGLYTGLSLMFSSDEQSFFEICDTAACSNKKWQKKICKAILSYLKY